MNTLNPQEMNVVQLFFLDAIRMIVLLYNNEDNECVRETIGY